MNFRSVIMNSGKELTRRDFLKLLWNGFVSLALLTMGGAGYRAVVEAGRFSVETVRLRLKKLPASFSGLRIVQISDIHMGGWMNLARFQQVAELITAQKPDVLLITGDFIIGHNFTEASQQSLNDLVHVLAPLAASIPSFAVLGNHDYWTNAEAVRQMLFSSGITDLTNSVVPLNRESESLYLCGVDDVWEGDVRLDDVINQLSDNHAAILLAHEPDFADTSAATEKFDLQISGHSHGGQVAIPLFGPPILPYLGRKYPSGLYKVGNMFQYTNRGVGTTRLPVRFNCPPEITVFELESID